MDSVQKVNFLILFIHTVYNTKNCGVSGLIHCLVFWKLGTFLSSGEGVEDMYSVTLIRKSQPQLLDNLRQYNYSCVCIGSLSSVRESGIQRVVLHSHCFPLFSEWTSKNWWAVLQFPPITYINPSFSNTESNFQRYWVFGLYPSSWY
jgi:hypothetical protein